MGSVAIVCCGLVGASCQSAIYEKQSHFPHFFHSERAILKNTIMAVMAVLKGRVGGGGGGVI